MFEDFDREKNDGTELAPGASDRAVVYCLWARLEAGDLDTEEAWDTLHHRYPADARFALLGAFAAVRHAASDRGAGEVLLAVCAIVATLPLPPDAVRDLFAVVRDAPAIAAQLGDAKELLEKFGATRTDAGEAGARLAKLERHVIEELHDRTLGNRPLATKLAAASAVHDHATLLEKNAEKPLVEYSPQAHLVVGDRVQHAKFGLGVVTAKRGNKAEIKFADARRTLICR